MDLRPQAQAKMNYVFNEDHASIVESPAVLAQYNTLINSFHRDSRAKQVPGGYVKIDFTYDYPLDVSRPRLILVLQPDGHEAAATRFISALMTAASV